MSVAPLPFEVCNHWEGRSAASYQSHVVGMKAAPEWWKSNKPASVPSPSTRASLLPVLSIPLNVDQVPFRVTYS
jgi:hypothetical protein